MQIPTLVLTKALPILVVVLLAGPACGIRTELDSAMGTGGGGVLGTVVATGGHSGMGGTIVASGGTSDVSDSTATAFGTGGTSGGTTTSAEEDAAVSIGNSADAPDAPVSEARDGGNTGRRADAGVPPSGGDARASARVDGATVPAQSDGRGSPTPAGDAGFVFASDGRGLRMSDGAFPNNVGDAVRFIPPDDDSGIGDPGGTPGGEGTGTGGPGTGGPGGGP